MLDQTYPARQLAEGQPPEKIGQMRPAPQTVEEPRFEQPDQTYPERQPAAFVPAGQPEKSSPALLTAEEQHFERPDCICLFLRPAEARRFGPPDCICLFPQIAGEQHFEQLDCIYLFLLTAGGQQTVRLVRIRLFLLIAEELRFEQPDRTCPEPQPAASEPVEPLERNYPVRQPAEDQMSAQFGCICLFLRIAEELQFAQLDRTCLAQRPAEFELAGQTCRKCLSPFQRKPELLQAPAYIAAAQDRLLLDPAQYFESTKLGQGRPAAARLKEPAQIAAAPMRQPVATQTVGRHD